MYKSRNFGVIIDFPDFKGTGFDLEEYNRQFREKNMIINARSSGIHYSDHWGPLSIKCAFNGKEYYKVDNSHYAVNDGNYLILNSGNYYSSTIDSRTEVESFTLNFRASLLTETLQSLSCPDRFLLDNYGFTGTGFEFVEKLYPHDVVVSPILFRMKELIHKKEDAENAIGELFFLLMEKMILNQKEVQKEIAGIPALRASTRKELYKRLIRARDYMDSCYAEEVTLEKLASVSLLNQTYFLRQFKSYFKVTPGKYLVARRMEAAKTLLEQYKELSITEICLEVGYNDLSSFSKLFKHHFHHSPEQFRKLISTRV
jgi:AraC family transcriptional regulator